jgi:hypothetical protein
MSEMDENISEVELSKMDLRTLINTIIDSAPEDWHIIADQPTYRDHLEFYEVYEGQSNVLHAAAHHSVAAYIPDVSVTMAWGLKWNQDFKEDWCKQFPDPKAHGCFLDVFFNNALVFRTAYVWVDGITFPLPRRTKDGDLQVTERACKLMKIIDRMGLAPRPDYESYESDLRRAGFTVVVEEWPKFPRKPSVYQNRGIRTV